MIALLGAHLGSPIICRMVCSQDQSELQWTDASSSLKASFASSCAEEHHHRQLPAELQGAVAQLLLPERSWQLASITDCMYSMAIKCFRFWISGTPGCLQACTCICLDGTRVLPTLSETHRVSRTDQGACKGCRWTYLGGIHVLPTIHLRRRALLLRRCLLHLGLGLLLLHRRCSRHPILRCGRPTAS